jgi:hypothetical protein
MRKISKSPLLALLLVGTNCILTHHLGATDPRDDASPWAFGSSAEWSKEFPKFNPLMSQAGSRWIRFWPEWSNIQPKQGDWKWEGADAILADAKKNNLRILGSWCYFAPWTSANGGTRKGPIKDMQFWRDYTEASVARYKDDIKYWEVWNEFNGSFYEGSSGEARAKEYADLVVAAYDATKKVDPSIKVGMSVANFDVNFLDMAIKAGAAGHFDFVCVHPYENMEALADGGEMGYLSLAGNLRDMLKGNSQPADIPLWITEVGFRAPVKPDPKVDAKQADILVKGYILSIVQGFQRVYWFEARGPAYGKDGDHGIIRADWTLRPSYDAYKTMTTLLGPEPKYLGWLDLGKGGYGFLFNGKAGNVLSAWAPPGKEIKMSFASAVHVTDLSGKETPLASGAELVLNNTPVFISDVPAELAKLAEDNLGKPYPWGGDYAKVETVTCRFGATNMENGIKHTNQKTTAVENGLVDTWRRTDFTKGGEGRYIYLRVDPQFVPFGTKDLDITIVAKRVSPDKSAGMNLTYESDKGYGAVKDGWWTIPKGDQWQEHTWKVNNANFVGQWGWNFRFDATGSANEFLIREVRVKKAH